MKKSIVWYFINIFLFLPSIFANSQSLNNGRIITQSKDTIPCSIVKLKNKKNDEISNYKEIEIVDSLGIRKKLYPKDIYAYIKNNTQFKSVSIEGAEIFMKLVANGKVTLYHYPGGIAGGQKYIFKKSEEKDFNVMDYEAQFKKLSGFNSGLSGNRSGSRLLVMDQSKPFISYFTEYFKDCPIVARKIKMEFYTRDDMVDIFKEYNEQCANKSL